MMHLCDKCLGTIPNHLPDQRVCSRCVEFAQVQAENKRLREALDDICEGVNEDHMYLIAKEALEGGGD